METLVAVSITLSLGAVAFQLFHQNEKLVRDQSLIFEMQQSARMAISQLSDDVRMAGQGFPFDFPEILLPGSGSTRVNLRSSYSATESIVVAPTPPVFLELGISLTLGVESTTGFSSGRQSLVWNESAWARSTINSVSGAARTLRMTPTMSSQTPIQFATSPTVSLDEGITIFWEPQTRVIRRATATNTEDAASPVWSPANELAANVTYFNVNYLDAEDIEITPDTSERRARVVAVNVRITVRSSAALSDGTRPEYSLSRRATMRNRLR